MVALGTGIIEVILKFLCGQGLLGLPSAIQQSGIVWGIIQLALCGVLNYYSLLTVVNMQLFILSHESGTLCGYSQSILLSRTC